MRNIVFSQLMLRNSQQARDSWSSLSSIAELITSESKNREEFLNECKSGRLNGVKAAYRTFNSVSITGRIEGEVSEELEKVGLKFLAHNGGSKIQQTSGEIQRSGVGVNRCWI